METPVRVEATIKEVLPNALYRAELQDGRRVLAHASVGLRMHVSRILPGDKVTLEISPFDDSRGRIVQRGSVIHPPRPPLRGGNRGVGRKET